MFANFLLFLVLGWSHLVATDTFDTSVCLFHLCSVDAGNNLTVGQLPGGQLQGTKVVKSATWFRLYNGRLLDQALRGCWWASPSTVLTCDVPFSDVEDPDELFSVTMHGDDQALTYNGTFSFYACRAGRYDKVNYHLKQLDSTCQQVFLHIDPDMACFSEPYFTTSTTPVFSFSTPVASIPEETITTDVVLTTVRQHTPKYTTTVTSTYYTTYETIPEPSSPPSTYTKPSPHSHSLSTIETSFSTSTLLLPPSPPLPSSSTLYLTLNLTSHPSLTTPAASDISTIPLKSFTGIFSWINSTTSPATLNTKTFSPGVASHSRKPVTTTHVTPTNSTWAHTTTKTTNSNWDITTLVFHTERVKESSGPVVATFTVTGEEGAVVTFAVEVEGGD